MNFLPKKQSAQAMPRYGSIFTNGIHLVPASSIQPESITWLLDGWLSAGKFHLLAGKSGDGKTTIAVAFMASFSNGTTGGYGWPGNSLISKGHVIFWSCEDGIEDTVVPRLIAAGADLSRIHIIRGTIVNGRMRPFSATDIPRLSQEIERIGSVGLIVIDPIIQVVEGDSNKNAEVRRALAPLLELAELHNFAVLGITHINKSSKGKDPIDRINGSLAYVAVARLVMMTARVESADSSDGPGSFVIVRAKSNIGPSDGGHQYQIEPFTFNANGRTIKTSRIAWSPAPLTGSAKEILKSAEGGGSGEATTVVEQSAEFLKQILATGGRSFADIERLSEEAGISIGSIKRAKLALGIISKKQTGMGQVSPYFWYLPEKSNRQMLDPGFVNLNAQQGLSYQPNPFNAGQSIFQQNSFQGGMQHMPNEGPIAGFSPQPMMHMSTPLSDGVHSAQSPASPASPAPGVSAAPPVSPVPSVENKTGEHEVSVNQHLLTWMVIRCQELLSTYQDDPTASAEDQYEDRQDRIVSIEFNTVAEGLDDHLDEEDWQIEKLYRSALEKTNWWKSINV